MDSDTMDGRRRVGSMALVDGHLPSFPPPQRTPPSKMGGLMGGALGLPIPSRPYARRDGTPAFDGILGMGLIGRWDRMDLDGWEWLDGMATRVRRLGTNGRIRDGLAVAASWVRCWLHTSRRCPPPPSRFPPWYGGWHGYAMGWMVLGRPYRVEAS